MLAHRVAPVPENSPTAKPSARVQFWGTRGSLAKPGRNTVRYGGNTSCVQLTSPGGSLVVIDCGTGAHDLGQALLAQAEGPLRGSILMGQESATQRMYHLAHEELYSDHYTSPEEHVARIEAVTLDQVADCARRYLVPDQFAVAALGPRDGAELSAGDWGA